MVICLDYQPAILLSNKYLPRTVYDEYQFDVCYLLQYILTKEKNSSDKKVVPTVEK